jgi:hypothetical protein
MIQMGLIVSWTAWAGVSRQCCDLLTFRFGTEGPGRASGQPNEWHIISSDLFNEMAKHSVTISGTPSGLRSAYNPPFQLCY